MKNISKILVLVVFCILLQDCSTGDVDNDFSYESLTDTISGQPFRNRKYDYAREKVNEEKSLIIPEGLNGNKIKPQFELPSGNNNYAKSQVREAQKEMLPPNYDVKFNMGAIIRDQISKVSVSVVYDDKGELKLVFREPLSITINLLDNYFKQHPDHYKITSEEDETLSGHFITVKDKKKNLVFVVKARKVDELSSLVTVTAVFKSDGQTPVEDYIDQGVSILSEVRENINGTVLKNPNNVDIAKVVEASESESLSKKGQSTLGGLLSSGKQTTFGAGSYDNTIKKSNEQKANQEQEQQDYNYTQMTAPSSDSQIYNSNTKAQVLNT